MSTTEDIEWGYNCLTQGVHHGRPEAIWNIPLLYAATTMFGQTALKELVISRIYNDAMQFVTHGEVKQDITTPEWADRVKQIAERKYDTALQHKVGEISKYYESPMFKTDLDDAIERNQMNKLNPGYKPLHPHDTINMLCRIIGVGSSIEASKD